MMQLWLLLSPISLLPVRVFLSPFALLPPQEQHAQTRHDPAVGVLRIDGPLDPQMIDEPEPDQAEAEPGR